MSKTKHGLKAGSIYHHYKGGAYTLVSIGRLEAFPDTEVAVYSSITGDQQTWVRSVE